MQGRQLIERIKSAMKKRYKLFAIIAALVLVLLSRSAISAATPTIQLEIIPASVQLDPGQETDVLIVVRNSTLGLLQEMRLSWFSDAGVTVTSDTLEVNDLQPDGSWAWLVHITKKTDGPTVGEVHFQLNYVWQAADASRTVPGIAIGTLEIQERPSESIDKVAEVQVETALDLLQEHQSGSIFLVVRNKSNVPVKVIRIMENKPDFIELELPDLGTGVTLAPQESHAFAVKATISDTVQMGKHMLLFEIGLEWEKSGRSWTGSLVTSHKFDVGILGESDILKLLGVPSFLMLPGFLMMMTFMLLWARVVPKKEIRLEAKSPEFWLIAISLSLITAPLYPLLTGCLGSPRNYLKGYGLRDVFQVWIGSLAAATLVWVFWTGGRSIITRVQEKRTVLSENDSPIVVLRKLARIGTSFPLKQADIKTNGKKERYFVIAQARGKVWIAPIIRFEWLSQDAGARQKFVTNLDKADSPDAMADLLKQGEKSRKLKIAWRDTGSKKGPTKVAESEVEILKQQPPRGFVEEGEIK